MMKIIPDVDSSLLFEIGETEYWGNMIFFYTNPEEFKPDGNL